MTLHKFGRHLHYHSAEAGQLYLVKEVIDLKTDIREQLWKLYFASIIYFSLHPGPILQFKIPVLSSHTRFAFNADTPLIFSIFGTEKCLHEWRTCIKKHLLGFTVDQNTTRLPLTLSLNIVHERRTTHFTLHIQITILSTSYLFIYRTKQRD